MRGPQRGAHSVFRVGVECRANKRTGTRRIQKTRPWLQWRTRERRVEQCSDGSLGYFTTLFRLHMLIGKEFKVVTDAKLRTTPCRHMGIGSITPHIPNINSEWLAPRFGHFGPGERIWHPLARMIGGPTISLDVVEERKISPYWESKPGSPARSLVAILSYPGPHAC
jgi:hypothetical protein